MKVSTASVEPGYVGRVKEMGEYDFHDYLVSFPWRLDGGKGHVWHDVEVMK